MGSKRESNEELEISSSTREKYFRFIDIRVNEIRPRSALTIFFRTSFNFLYSKFIHKINLNAYFISPYVYKLALQFPQQSPLNYTKQTILRTTASRKPTNIPSKQRTFTNPKKTVRFLNQLPPSPQKKYRTTIPREHPSKPHPLETLGAGNNSRDQIPVRVFPIAAEKLGYPTRRAGRARRSPANKHSRSIGGEGTRLILSP